MDNEIVYFSGTKVAAIDELAWNEHPGFKGVFMKNMLCGCQTNQKLSTHLVKILPHCEIGDHMHDGKSELHEILEGQGVAIVNNTEIHYEKGTVSFIPENMQHKITAGEQGLLLMAKFTPALN